MRIAMLGHKVFFFIIIVWGGSRKCLLLALASFVLNYLINTDKENLKRKIVKYFKIAVLIILFGISVFKVPILYEKIGYRIEGYFNKTDSSGNTRDAMRDTAHKYIKEHPIKGYGLNTYRDISEFKTWSECNYLELTFGGGIFLTVFYYSYYLYLIVYLFKRKAKGNVYKILFIILFCQVLFDYMSMSYIGRFDTFFVAVSSLLVYFDKKENQREA